MRRRKRYTANKKFRFQTKAEFFDLLLNFICLGRGSGIKDGGDLLTGCFGEKRNGNGDDRTCDKSGHDLVNARCGNGIADNGVGEKKKPATAPV